MSDEVLNMHQVEGRFKYSPKLRTSDPFRIKKRPEEHERTAFKVSDIQAKHHQVKRMIFMGFKGSEIAQALGVSQSFVSNVKQSPIIKMQLDAMQGAVDAEAIDVKKEIDLLTPYALANLEEVIMFGTIKGEKVNTNLIAKESNNIIDRSEGRATQKIETKNAHVFVTSDELKHMRANALAEMSRKRAILQEKLNNECSGEKVNKKR